MIKCTHCGCQLESRLTVWVHVHSGLHQCDGWTDIAVPIIDVRGRIIRHWPTLTSAPDSWGVQYEKETP